MAITRELWIHPSTLVQAKYIIKYGSMPKGSGIPWEWTNPKKYLQEIYGVFPEAVECAWRSGAMEC
jgi:hypothetical protein